MDKNVKNITKTKLLVLTALLFSVALVLAILENSFPPLFVTVPGVKLGLSNIPVMYALFFLDRKPAFMIAVLKASYVTITRGFIAGILSLCGGILSLLIMLLLVVIFRDKISYFVLSIFGAVFHNIGQFVAISLIYTNIYLWVYLPVLLISGVFAGMATSVLLKLIMPAFNRMA